MSLSPAERLAKKKPPKHLKSLRGHGKPFECSLRMKRKELGLTMREVAEGSGVNVPGIWRCEIGAEVELSKALMLASFFGVPVEQLWKLKQNGAAKP